MTIYGIDAASFQGNVNWASVDNVCDFGFEKVSEGRSYVNPFWPAAKTAMKARAKATGFLPGAYVFMDYGEGAPQADHFAATAGDLSGFAIAVDLERAPNGSPTISQAKACVARLRQHYPNHPIGGYAPHWYTGTADLRFFDWLWASHYVSGTGSPASLYAKVPSTWWAAYGGMAPALLQFTSSATVSGVSGRVDVSAFKGSLDQLRALALGTPQEDDMALSADDKKWLEDAIFRNVWKRDELPAPGSNPNDQFGPPNPGFDPVKNPTWAGESFPKQTVQALLLVLDRLGALATTGGTVDLDALAGKIAPLVADELAKRLEN